jgi:hypothetical protein
MGNGDVFCRRFVWSGSTLAAQGGETQVTASPTGKTGLRVGWLGPKVLLTWSDDGGTPLQEDIKGIALDPGTCQACDLPFTVPRANRYDSEPVLATQHATGPTSGDQALIVFRSAQLVPPFDSEIIAQRFEAIGAGGTLVSLGGGCGGTFPMSFTGPLAIANANLALKLDGVGGTTAVFTSIGIPGAPAVPCGTCQITVPLALVLARYDLGSAFTPFRLNCDMSLVGAQLELQGWVFGTAISPCPLVPALSFSDRYLATIGL